MIGRHLSRGVEAEALRICTEECTSGQLPSDAVGEGSDVPFPNWESRAVVENREAAGTGWDGLVHCCSDSRVSSLEADCILQLAGEINLV